MPTLSVTITDASGASATASAVATVGAHPVGRPFWVPRPPYDNEWAMFRGSSGVRQLTSSGPPDPWSTLDGRLNAPVGATVQFPTLLNPYGTGAAFTGAPPAGRYRFPTNHTWPSSGNLIQPPWMVAGIDYPVGINASALPLKDVSSNTTLGGSLVTTASISGQTLTFSSIPNWVQSGMFTQCVDGITGDPAQFAFPPGTTISSPAGNQVTISNAPHFDPGSGANISFSHYRGIYPHSTQFIVYILEDNITMDGWDFSAGNGWGFDSEQQVGVILQNFKATFGSNMSTNGIVNTTLINNAFVFNSGGTVQYGEFYCNGATVGIQTALGLYGGIGRSVTTTAQFLYIKEASGEAIRCADSFGGSNILIRDLVIQDCGTGQAVFGFHGDSVQCFVATGITQKSLQKRFVLMYQQQDVNLNGAANQGFTVNGLGNAGTNGVIQQDITANCTQVVTGNANMNGFVNVGNPPNTQDNEITDNYAAISPASINPPVSWQFSNKQAPGTINVEHGNVFMNDGTTLT